MTSCASTRPVRQQQLITGPRILAEEDPTKSLRVDFLSNVKMLRLRTSASPPASRLSRVGVVTPCLCSSVGSTS